MIRAFVPAVFTSPSISYAAVSPVLAVAAAAVVGVLIDAFAPARLRWRAHVPIALGGLAVALAAVGRLAGTARVTAAGAVAVDKPALFLEGTVLILAIASVLLVAERSAETGGGAFVAQASQLPGSAAERTLAAAGHSQTEVFPLLSFAVVGMLLFITANDLLLMFVALEVLSLPLYLLCGLARRRRLLSQEAAVKYFLLGAFSSAFFLYGLALLYGFANTVSLGGIAAAAQSSQGHDALLFLGLALLGVGLLFKIGAAPFQAWIPDVYQGAPTPITAFMATATKVAAFGALMRVLYAAFSGLTWDWRPVIWAVAILTMVVGAVLAVTQSDVKRMLAYSSVAHAGFILTGVAAASRRGLSGSLFYLLVYGLTTVGAFAFLLLSLAGIPLTSGFVGKFAVFQAAADGGAAPLVVIGVLTSAIAAFFYVRVIVLMFFNEPVADGPTVVVPGVLTSVSLAFTVAATLLLGIFPQPILDLAGSSVPFLR